MDPPLLHRNLLPRRGLRVSVCVPLVVEMVNVSVPNGRLTLLGRKQHQGRRLSGLYRELHLFRLFKVSCRVSKANVVSKSTERRHQPRPALRVQDRVVEKRPFRSVSVESNL
jgi:hypothetical protein